MIPYTAPLADIRFILTRLIGLDRLAALPGHEELTAETVDAVLEAAAEFASGVFAPLNETGDKIGAAFKDGKVTMPPGFREAYRAHVEGGWNGLPAETEWGGQDLPWSLAMPVQEMWQAANLALALCPLLNQGAIELLAAYGSAELKAKFLPKLVSGAWTGTMNLTEPQAGSDVGAVRCRAVKDGDHYRITGQKIFISYGDHDLTDNILHLVLARLPGAPEGTRGLSLFLVPKILVNDDGALGEVNDVRTVSIEHKLGQHASPTCVMAYGDNGGAIGYLVGAENGGITAMFTMMNNARIGVGVQALGLMDRSYQQARDFAKTRIQARDIANPKAPPVTIIHHPDVRRMLMLMRSQTEAARALAMNCAFAVDAAQRHSGDAQHAASARVDLLTPIVKAWLTELGNEVTSLGVQIHGGMGYIEETGAAQHMRDARVLAIYEGTNGIQANDLVFRKLARDDGAALNHLLDEIETDIDEAAHMSSSALAGEIRACPGLKPGREGHPLAETTAKNSEPSTPPDSLTNLSASLTHLRASALWITAAPKTNPALAAASAATFLRLAGNTLGGFYLIKSAWLAAQDLAAGNGEPEFLKAKIATAHFYASQILPQSAGLAAIIMNGGGAVATMPEDLF